MKHRFLFFFLCLFAAAPAAAWSHWKNFNPVLAKDEKPFLVHRLAGPARNGEITFCTEGNFPPEESAYFADCVTRSVNRWLSAVPFYIRRAGAEQQFADLLPLFDTPPYVRQIPCPQSPSDPQPDLHLFIAPRQDIQQRLPRLTGGAFKWDRSVLYLDTSFFDEEKFERTLTHELGHAFGLADRYNPGAAADGSVFYSTSVFYPAVMNTSYQIECDDAEGIINLLDRITPSPRSRYGWKTICRPNEQSPVFYRNGKPEPQRLFPDKFWAGAGLQRIDGKEHYFAWDALALATPGKRLYAAGPFTQLQYNDRGLPAYTVTADGTYAYYFYGIGRFAVLLGKTPCQPDVPFEDGKTACRIAFEEQIIVTQDEENPRTLLWSKTRRQAQSPLRQGKQQVLNLVQDGTIEVHKNGTADAEIQCNYSDDTEPMRFKIKAGGKPVSVPGTPTPPPQTPQQAVADALENAVTPGLSCPQACRQEIAFLTGLAARYFALSR